MAPKTRTAKETFATTTHIVLPNDTNVLGNLATACTWMLAMLVWLVVLGGFLSVPSYGFLSFVIVPVLGVMIIPQAGTRDELHALGRRRGRRG